MKNVFFGLLAVALAVGASAFTSAKKETSKSLFSVQKHFNKVSPAPGDEFNAANYDDVLTDPCNGESTVPCIINYDTNQGTLQDYLDWASTNGLSIQRRRD